MLIDWPVAERGSSRISVATSSSVGTIFSMPEIATCTLGSVVRQRRVALVGDEHHRARLRDEEVAAGDAHVGGQVVIAQHAARLEAQLLDAVLARRAVLAAEQLGHLFLALVQRRADDVRRRLVVVDLQDVLAEIGLDDRACPAPSIAWSSADSSDTIDFDLMILRTPCRCGDLEHQLR